MAFTNFCCRSGGSNLNAGTRTGSTTEPGTAADFTYASGNWVASTGVFTVASGNPQTDGVAVGDFASVYPDGSTTAVFIGRVTARNATTITVSLSAKSGTAPTDGTGNRTLKIGGAWLGPNGTESFPFGFAAGVMMDASSNPLRINFKNDQTYSISAAMAHSGSTLINAFFRGYTSAYGDAGRATIDSSTNAIVPLTINTGGNLWFEDFIFKGGAASGTDAGVSVWPSIGSTQVYFKRCVFRDFRGAGLAWGSANGIGGLYECEFYGCNSANTASVGCMSVAGRVNAYRCIFHDAAGSNVMGVSNNGNFTGDSCVFDTIGKFGVGYNNGTTTILQGCDFYNCTSHGIGTVSGSGTVTILLVENCNFILNGGYGIDPAGTPVVYGHALNCGFGSGTQANTSGQVNTGLRFTNIDAVTYAADVTPWIDPANGDFRITLASAKGAGRGAWLQTASSYAGTVGYPDIGAAQHQDSGGGSTIRPHIGGKFQRLA